MKFKKIMATTLSMAMIIGSSMSVLAEEAATSGETTGTGEVEGYVTTDVFSFILPTDTNNAFNFILDPQGLIAATEQAAYSGKTFEDGATLFFANSDGDTNYSSASDEFTITNKSSMAIDVSVNATLTGIDGITMASSDAFTADDTTASMYLALVSGETENALTSSGASLTGTIDATDESAFEYTYADGAYSYGLKADTSEITFGTYTFNMVGACNQYGDWSELTEAAPTVGVVWSVAEHVDNAAPSIATKEYELTADTPVTVNMSFGAGELAATGVASVSYTLSGSTGSLAGLYTIEGNILTIDAAAVNAIISANATATVTVVFDDTASTSVDLTLAPASAGE